MRVVFLPYGEGNPYLDLLASALERKGCQVLRPRINTFFIFPLLFQWQPQVLHLHWIHVFHLSKSRILSLIKALVFLSQIMIARLFGIRIIWTLHNLINHARQSPQIDLFCSKWVARLASGVIIHGPSVQSLAQETLNIPAEKLQVIPHGNYIHWYTQTVSRKEAREKLGLPMECRVLLAFGAIHPYKGLENLIRCFPTLPEPSARLLIAGNPATNAYGQDLLRLTAGDSRIILSLGFIPDADVQLYFAACDATVFPFTEILTSGSVILAMSFSCPIIAPLSGCVADILSEHGGFPYDNSEPEGLIRAMTQALKSGQLVEMGKHNRRLAESFDWVSIAEKTIQIYQLTRK